MTDTSPNNHGKKWTESEDEHIKLAPSLPDAHFAQLLKRSEQAVKSRRAVLAVKLHKNGGLSIQECAEQLHADAGRTIMVINNEGRATAQKAAVKPYTTILPRAAPRATVPTPVPSNIAAICNHIKQRGENFDAVWAQDFLAPTLVQYHAGFKAYAAFISNRQSAKHDAAVASQPSK